MLGGNVYSLTSTTKVVAVQKNALWRNNIKVVNLGTFPLGRKACVEKMILIIIVSLTCLE